MNSQTLTAEERIRLVFELERADNPRLYDNLIRFKKGVKQVSRLRTLAHEGVLAENGALGMAGGPAGGQVPVDAGRDEIIGQVFEEPLED